MNNPLVRIGSTPEDDDDIIDLGQLEREIDIHSVSGFMMKLKKITTTDEAKVQVVLETEGASEDSLNQLKSMLVLQQTCPVLVSMEPVQRDIFDA